MISVVVPVYNAQIYLEACIESIINQEYSNWKLILVNDGSIDSSLLICEKYAKADPRITVISQDNKGQSAARNLGLSHVTSPYVMFVDADDEISKDLINENIALFQNNDELDIIQFPYYRDFTTSHQKIITYKSEIIDSNFFKNWLEYNKISWLVWDKVYKTKLFDNLKFKEGIVYEDNLMIAHLLQEVKSIYLSDKGLYYYFRRENSTTTSKTTQKKEEDSLYVTEEIAKLLYKNGERDLLINFLVRIYNIKRSLFINFGVSKPDLKIELNSIGFLEILRSKITLKEKIKLFIYKYAH